MDIQKIISEIVARITGKSDLIAAFTKDPIAAVKDLLGIDIDADQIQEIISGVTTRLNLTAAKAGEEVRMLPGTLPPMEDHYWQS